MAIIEMVGPQPSIPDMRFKTAAWICFLGIILVIPSIVVVLLTDSQPPVSIMTLFLYWPMVLVGTACSFYIFIQFRRLLNERCGFHAVDQIILWIIIIDLFTAAIDVSSKTITVLIPSLSLIKFLGIGIDFVGMVIGGILGIILGSRLLSIQDNLFGLLRPYAILTLVAAACQTVIILIPISCILMLPLNIVLGMIFLRAADVEPQAEFV
jgi:hypothetical protein